MTDLISLADAKAFLNISTSTDDAKIQDKVTAASKLIEERVGPAASDEPFDEWYDGGSVSISLLHRPVQTVTSVSETYGANINRTLTEQPLDGVTAVDAYGYTIDKTTGLLTRRISGIAAPFAAGRRNVHVVYTAGYSTVPQHLQEATKLLVQHMWETQRGAAKVVKRSDESDPPAPFTWPRRVLEMIELGSEMGIA